jgi:tetratricopeptide (TPR) repeat protein
MVFESLWKKELFIDLNYASYFETPEEQIKYEKQLLEIDDQLPYFYYRLGLSYSSLFQYEEAIPGFEKSLALSDKLGSKPGWIQYYTHLGYVYHKSGQYKKEKKLYKKAQKDFPDNAALLFRQAVLSLTVGDSVRANEYIGKYVSLRKDNSESEANILSGLADIYSEADIPDKAEAYYRQAFSLEPMKPGSLYELSCFLIEKDRNIKEGLELIEKALELTPDDYRYLDCKGWGLYKRGKNNEALELLEKSDSLKPIYDHKLYLHLQEVKKTIANQKNNKILHLAQLRFKFDNEINRPPMWPNWKMNTQNKFEYF